MIIPEEAFASIYADATDILDTVGIRVLNDEALSLLAAAGCRIKGDLVLIHAGLIQECLASTPARWLIYDRNGHETLRIGEGKAYIGTADAAPFQQDYKTGARRNFVLDDVRDGGKLADALLNIDFVCPFGEAQDISLNTSVVHSFKSLLENTTKPIAIVVPDLACLKGVVELASAVRGSLESLRKKPLFFTLFEPSSPLIYTRESLEKMLWLAGRGLPFFISSTISLGATTPVTLAGALVQCLAETLAGLVMAQLKNKGTPVGIGASLGVMDMANGQFVFGAAENTLGNAAFIEIVKHLKVPIWSNGLHTQSKTEDAQAAIEAFMTCLTSAQTGADVVVNAGYLESGKTSSFEMVVMADEMAGMVKRYTRGIEVNAETRAKEVIKSVGPGGNFLAEDHTFENFRKELWFPTIMDWQSYENWEAAGRLTLKDRIIAKIDYILNNHQARPLDDSVQARLDEIIKHY